MTAIREIQSYLTSSYSSLYDWEYALVAKAAEAYTESYHEQSITLIDKPQYQFESKLLNDAYTLCEQITAQHSQSFYLASRLLPKEKRRAIRALYAFCRISDDIVDMIPSTEVQQKKIAMQKLTEWQEQLSLKCLDRQLLSDLDLVAIAWSDTSACYAIPAVYGKQLLEGVTSDLYKNRYQNFNELAAYSYSVASTVGLMSMHIIGYSGPEAIPYAIRLGVALQITNILRDIAEDWQTQRLYLPQEELKEFGLTEMDIAHSVESGLYTEEWRAFMRFQIERNRSLYRSAWPGIALLNREGRFAIAAAGELYQAILTDVERYDYDVFSRRAYVSRWGKLRRLPRIWWRRL